MSSDADRLLVETERITSVLQQAPLTLGVTVLNSMLTAFVLAPVVSHTLLSIWIGLIVCVSTARWALRQLFFRRRPKGTHCRPWAVISVLGSLTTGILWGGAAALLPAVETYQLFLSFVIGGMCAGTTMVNSAHFPTVLAFILPSTLPLAAAFLAQTSALRLVSALMIVVFALAMALTSLRGHRAFGDRIRLQLALTRRGRKLSEANQRLREEMAERQKAEATLHQAQKMEAMGQLTGGVAHDFNNLLTPIVGALDMLQRRGLGGEREQRHIARALQSADRAKILVHRLLAFARRQPLQPTAVHVGELVAGMADLLSSTIGPQVRVAVEVADDLPSAKADHHQLEMALLNLGVNARDAMPDGGTLRISATAETVPQQRGDLRPGRYVRLSVADTGLGMDALTLARAVEPFFSTKGIGKGTGLGLSMAHGLAAQLGGALTIQSRRGVGTNVELWLPVSATVPQIVEVPDEPVDLGEAQGLALLVDDEDDVRASTADMLSELGYRVLEADSGETALAFVTEGKRPDLLVTDHLMPGMSGVDLARAVKGLLPETPVLIVSGYAELDDVAPDLPRLTKPFRSAELAASLASLA